MRLSATRGAMWDISAATPCCMQPYAGEVLLSTARADDKTTLGAWKTFMKLVTACVQRVCLLGVNVYLAGHTTLCRPKLNALKETCTRTAVTYDKYLRLYGKTHAAKTREPKQQRCHSQALYDMCEPKARERQQLTT